jgi:hypothetical protein
VFLLKSQDLKFTNSKSEAEYAGKTYVKKSSFPQASSKQALAESRKQLELGIICLVVRDETDIELWILKKETVFELSFETQQELIKVLSDSVGPIGKVLLERTLPQSKSLEDLIDQISKKVPSSAREKFKLLVNKSLGI